MSFDAVGALVPRVQQVLVPSRPTDAPKFAIYQADEVAQRNTLGDESHGKHMEMGRPRCEGSMIDEVRELVVHVLHLRTHG